MRVAAALAWMFMATLAGMPATAQQASPPPTSLGRPPRGDTPPIDYRDPATWMCRPGVDDGTCSANLDALAVDVQARRTPAPFVKAADPKIDCFYVYPTTSLDPTIFSDLKPDAEEKRAVHGQAARLGEKCRLFVPIYHSLTMTALRYGMTNPGRDDVVADINSDVPYRDILAAWRAYLANDNKGRGVVLVGHSQGSIILKRLIAEEIDGKPARKLLVAAYLAGNPDLSAKTFKTIPPCRAADQTGCVVAWSSYRDTYQGERAFGGGTDKGEPPLCVNPAALAGGAGSAKAYFSKPAIAPAGDPPYVELIGQLRAECVADDKGAVLRFAIVPGPLSGLLEMALSRPGLSPTWGMHSLDISLVQGNMVDLIGSQAEAWGRRK